jgi:hypothetical protein
MNQLQKIERVLNRAGRVVASQPEWVTKVENQACLEKALEKKRFEWNSIESTTKSSSTASDNRLQLK